VSVLTAGSAVLATFFVADAVYTIDHYLVHRDRKRYAATHSRHHRRYNGSKDAPQLDAYELSTYTTAAVMLLLVGATLSLFTGNIGFVVGALLKYAHSLTFHVYQHRWWGQVPIRQQRLDAPRAHWGIASAHYHSRHHSHPNDRPFTYAESWAGFDRVLEAMHPRLVRFTVDGSHDRRSGDSQGVAS